MRRLRLLAFGAAMLFVPLGCEDFGVELLSPSKPLPLAGTVRVSRWTPRLLD